MSASIRHRLQQQQQQQRQTGLQGARSRRGEGNRECRDGQRQRLRRLSGPAGRGDDDERVWLAADDQTPPKARLIKALGLPWTQDLNGLCRRFTAY